MTVGEKVESLAQHSPEEDPTSSIAPAASLPHHGPPALASSTLLSEGWLCKHHVYSGKAPSAQEHTVPELPKHFS